MAGAQRARQIRSIASGNCSSNLQQPLALRRAPDIRERHAGTGAARRAPAAACERQPHARSAEADGTRQADASSRRPDGHVQAGLRRSVARAARRRRSAREQHRSNGVDARSAAPDPSSSARLAAPATRLLQPAAQRRLVVRSGRSTNSLVRAEDDAEDQRRT